MDENLFYVRRSSYNRQTTFRHPTLKIEFKGNRFILSRSALDLLRLKDGDGVMFVFNRKWKTAYIVKDLKEDSFRIAENREGNARWTSKELANHFKDVFDLLDYHKAIHYFCIANMPNDNLWFELALKQ